MSDLGILTLLSQATLVVQCVIGLLVVMSLTSWSIIFVKMLGLASSKREAIQDTQAFRDATDLHTALRALGNGQRLCHAVAQEGVGELNRNQDFDLSDEKMRSIVLDNIRRALRKGVSDQTARATGAIPFLATCANAAPFIGLFGTVWGIMNSFHAIGQMKTASLAAVAPGISEALVATAIGLVVAIPATIAYNYFLGKLTRIEAELINFAGVFLNRVQRELASNGNS